MVLIFLLLTIGTMILEDYELTRQTVMVNLTCCVNLGKLLNLSKPVFSFLIGIMVGFK